MAMKPEERPMSLTTPTPRYALLASTLAANNASCACSTAVSKPKHLSICGHSRGCDSIQVTVTARYVTVTSRHVDSVSFDLHR